MSTRIGEGLRWGGLLTVLTVAVMRCATSFPPQVWFDVDPAFDPTRLAGLGPAGSLLLDAMLWLGCAMVLVGEWLTKRGLEGKLLILALLPLPVVLYHGWSDGGDLWRGSTWAAGAMACVAVAHLVRDARMRPVVMGVLLAMCVPLLCRGVMQMTVEHEATVKGFEDMREEFFAQKGWGEDSPAASIYERRLRQPQPLGWFDTANVFGSVMAFSLVALVGLAWESVRRKRPSGYAGLAGLLGLAAGAGLGLTGSKGAMLAAGAGIALFILLQGKKYSSSWVRLAAPGLMFAAMFGVIVRGLLPEGFLGDKSLLFRWHYLVSSKGIFFDHPGLGVGPDGYQQAYMLHRVPRNPEEVVSAHSMFVDWMCSLGVMGLAWVGLVVLLAWRSGRRDERSELEERDLMKDAGIGRWVAPVLIGIVGLGLAMATEWHVLSEQDVLIRLVGLGGFILVGGVLCRILESAGNQQGMTVLGCALAAFLVHSQIEMTFHQPGAVVWAFCVVGAIGGGRRADNEGGARRGAGLIFPLISVGTAGWIMMRGALPAWKQEQDMAAAAGILNQEGAAFQDAHQEAERRTEAAGVLEQAFERWPIEVNPLVLAARELAMSMMLEPEGSRKRALEKAIELAEQSSADPSSLALRSRLYEQRGFEWDQVEDLDRAIDLARELARLDPQGIQVWVRLGDLYWKDNRIEEAKEAYKSALQHSLNFELDPLKQLPERERMRLEKRVRE